MNVKAWQPFVKSAGRRPLSPLTPIVGWCKSHPAFAFGLLPLLGMPWLVSAAQRIGHQNPGTPPWTLDQVVLWTALFSATITDVTHRKIYNWISYPALGWAAAIAGLVTLISWISRNGQVDYHWSWLGSMGLPQFVLGAMGCGAIMLIPYALSGGGAGDVKLAAVMGGLLGWEHAIWALAIGYILAATWAGVAAWSTRDFCLLFGGLFRKFSSSLLVGILPPPSLQQQQTLNRPIPMAGFFALATVFVVQ